MKIDGKTLQKFSRQVLKLGKRAIPGMLVGGAVVTSWFSGFQAGLAKPKADKLIEKKKEELGVEKLGVVETVKTTAKVYAGAAATGAVSVAMAGAGISIGESRLTAMTTAYDKTVKELDSWKEQATEIVGKEKTDEIQSKVAAKAVNDMPEKAAHRQMPTNFKNGEMPVHYLDTVTGQDFWSTPARMIDAEKQINRYLYANTSISLNDILSCFDDAAFDDVNQNYMGDLLGVSADSGPVTFDCHAQTWPEDGTPIMSIEWNHKPTGKF